jgi:hypothetical protein
MAKILVRGEQKQTEPTVELWLHQLADGVHLRARRTDDSKYQEVVLLGLSKSGVSFWTGVDGAAYGLSEVFAMAASKLKVAN